MNSLSVGNCRIERDASLFKVIDDIDRELLITRYEGVALLFQEVYNKRGSDCNLATGEWL